MSNSSPNLQSDTNSPVRDSFWRFGSSRKTPGVAKPINNHLPHKFEKFNGNLIPKSKKDIDSSAIFNHNAYTTTTHKIVVENGVISSSTEHTDVTISHGGGGSLDNLNSPDYTSPKTNGHGHHHMSTNVTSENHLSLSSSSTSSLSSSGGDISINKQNAIYNEKASKLKKFEKFLGESNVDLDILKKIGWRGIPEKKRSMAWKILLGYLPSNGERREEILERKRKEYRDCLPQYYISEEKRTDPDKKTLKQIQMDVPRTNPSVPLFQQPIIQEILERILYIWAIRHPSTGYVQGINDLATPFIYVFLSEFVENVEQCTVNTLESSVLAMVEADSYWCLTKLLDGIQDHYTFAQPGIQRMIAQLRGLLETINSSLCCHLAEQDCQFIEFAFRWMNCFLMREIPFLLVIRMWDTYLCEREGFSIFHVYVCAAFLVLWSDELKQKDFPDIMIFLQKPPTQNWQDRDIEDLFSTAHLYRELYHNAQSHLKRR
ncbi:TBC domain protein [Cavenderia fasciculata]|uniref:TBC domain protein n=1 Tax=Cavenderia fasciculata TaxID=261658 RepID=F4PIT3_CACFS|nr:TBC domain protein [Cavenderia fasciculata]EGG24662.1 TBC domain protein [Cavenderia fasciculata]|eukprot:XP_004362513.1 TBC domain protein [Cavenderia fasciculata]